MTREPGWAEAGTSDKLSGFKVPGTARQQRVFVAGGGALALLMLAGFYLVINQGVQRAHLHWAEAIGSHSGARSAEACTDASRRASSEACLSARLDAGQRRTTATSVSLAR